MNFIPVAGVACVYYFLLFALFFTVFGLFIAWQNCPVHNHIGIAHIVQDIFQRKIKPFDSPCDYCPDAVVSTSLVCRSRFISVRKVVSPKKSATCDLCNSRAARLWSSLGVISSNSDFARAVLWSMTSSTSTCSASLIKVPKNGVFQPF